MTYNTPELLLIGSAQNLVLTGNNPSFGLECAKSDEQVGSDFVESW